MPFEHFEEPSSTIETDEEMIRADEFFQRKGLSEKQRNVAHLALKDLDKGGKGSVGPEHIKDMGPEELREISEAIREWLENKPESKEKE